MVSPILVAGGRAESSPCHTYTCTHAHTYIHLHTCAHMHTHNTYTCPPHIHTCTPVRTHTGCSIRQRLAWTRALNLKPALCREWTQTSGSLLVGRKHLRQSGCVSGTSGPASQASTRKKGRGSFRPGWEYHAAREGWLWLVLRALGVPACDLPATLTWSLPSTHLPALLTFWSQPSLKGVAPAEKPTPATCRGRGDPPDGSTDPKKSKGVQEIENNLY